MRNAGGRRHGARSVSGVDATQMRARVAGARVGRLATVTRTGRPHVVPCCFALVDDTVVSAVDAKPKSTLALRRIDNIRTNPAATLLVDHYDDDWTALWWVRVDGSAVIVADPSARDNALAALRDKYPQYREQPPVGPVISLTIEAWRGWSYDDAPTRRSNP
jgi:PPOX class probable F420-dependent enzyme